MSTSTKRNNRRLFIFVVSIFLFNISTLFAQTNLDAAIENLISPLAPHNNEQEFIKIRIKNSGDVPIGSIKVKCRINGIEQSSSDVSVSVPVSSASNINPNIILTISGATIPDNINNVYEFIIDRVNGLVSSKTNNDTLRVQFGTPLSGTKTIGSSSSDFKTIADAVNSVRYNGIAGDIKFRIREGIYYDPIILQSSEVYFANGNSSIQFETFSNKKDVQIITGKTVKSSILFDGIKNASVKNLKVLNTCEFIGIGIQYLNMAHNGYVYNCEVSVDSISNLKAFAGVCIGDIGPAPSYSILNVAKVNSTKVSNCKISGGTYGILATGNFSIPDTLILIDSNEIRQVSLYGIVAQYQINTRVNRNRILFRSSVDSKSVGIYMKSVNTILPGIITVSQNYIRGAGFSGIQLLEVKGIGFPSNRLIDLSNNMIAGGFTSNSTDFVDVPKGINILNSGSINIFFNSVVMDAPVNKNAIDNTSALYILGSTSVGMINVMNNNLINRNAGFAYYNASSLATNPVLNSDYNNYWVEKLDTITNITNGFAYWNNGVRIGLQSLQLENNRDSHSLSIDPMFLSNIDLHTYSRSLDQKGSSYPSTTVEVDFDGDLRDQFANPDIGADEIMQAGEDLALLDVYPKVFKSALPTPWQIKVGYFGPTNGNRTLYFRYKIDGVDQLTPENAVPIIMSGLTNYKTILVNVPPSLYINRTSSFVLTVYISTGNIGDLLAKNDTISVNISIGMEGVYTYNLQGTGTRNFKSINDLYRSLQGGLAGPTTIEFAEGVYKERLVFGDIPNASDVNSLTITSATKNPYKTIITSAEGSENLHATITLNNARYINIKNLGIENTAFTNGSAIQLTGNSQFNIIENNIIKLDSLNGSTSANLNGIISSKLGTNTAGRFYRNASNNIIRRNRISGGNCGIILSGQDTNILDNGNIIEGNRISAYRYAGIQIHYSNTNILNNTIDGKLFSPSQNTYGLLLNGMIGYKDSDAILIDGNKIVNNSTTGINLNICYGYINTSLKKFGFQLSNNMVGGIFPVNSSNVTGITLQTSGHVMILNNTVYVNTPRSSSSTPSENVAKCLRIANSCNEIEAYNNILYSTNGAIPLEYYTRSSVSGSGNTGLAYSNNNLLYSSFTSNTSTPLILIVKNTNTAPLKSLYSFPQTNQIPYNALLNFRNDPLNNGRETKSVAYPLSFANAPHDLHSFDLLLNNVSSKSITVNKDIDKQRRTKFIDVGADENIDVSTDLEVTRIYNKLVSFINSNELKVELTNRGVSSIVNSKAILSYGIRNLNNTLIFKSSDTVDINLNSQAGFQYTFKKKFNLPISNNYSVCVYLSMVADTSIYNNTQCKDLCTGTEGNIYVGFNKNNPIPGTDSNKYFPTINDALLSINCGLSGETTIHLNPGSSPYKERIRIPKYELSDEKYMLTIKPYNTNDSTAVVVELPSGTAGNELSLHYNIQLNGANNIRLLNLNIRNVGPSFGSGVHITNNAQNNIIEGCKIEVDYSPNPNPNGDLHYGIAFTSDARLNIDNSASLSNSGNNNRIIGNTIIGGVAGIAMIGKSDLENINGNFITRNNISKFSKYGIIAKFSSKFEINNNQISPGLNSVLLTKNIAIYNANNGGRINANYIANVKSEGIKLMNINGNESNPLIVSNNWIMSGITSPIVDSAGSIVIRKSTNVNVYNNSIRYDGVNYALNIGLDSIYNSNQAKYLYFDVKNIRCVNNIIYVDSNSANLRKPYIIYFNSLDLSNYFNNNAYFSQYNNLFARTRNINYRTLQNWTSSNARDALSVYEAATFISKSNLNLNNQNQFNYQGASLPSVPKDYYNNFRNPWKGSIGAVEYNSITRNVSLYTLATSNIKYGLNEIACYIINEGIDNISTDSVALEFSADSGLTWMGYQTVKLDSLTGEYKSQYFKFNTKLAVNSFQPVKLKVRISPTKRLLNDIKDTLEYLYNSYCVGLRDGQYLLSKTNVNADLKSIQESLNAINCGFENYVVINMDAGVYSEDLNFGNLPSSPHKSITFKSSTNSNVIWKTFSANRKSIVELRSCENISFKNITFESNKLSDFVAIHLLDSIDNIKFSDCKFKLNKDPQSTDVFAISTNRENAFTRSRVVKNIRIEACEFDGGNSAISIKSYQEANKNIDIVNSKFYNIYNNAIYISAANIDSISYNRIDLKNSAQSSIGIRLVNLNKSFIVSNNQIFNCADESLLIDSSYSLINSLVVSNMMVGSRNKDGLNSNILSVKNFGINPLRGVYQSANLELNFNSLLQPSNGFGNVVSSVLNFESSNSLSLLGNIAINNDNSYVVKFVTGSDDIDEFKYTLNNLLYTSGPILALWRNVSCSTLTDLGQQDAYQCPFNVQNSPKGLGSFLPNYKNEYDLHLNDERLDGVVDMSTVWSYNFHDIDAELLDKNTNCDVGCDQFEIEYDLSLNSIIEPVENQSFLGDNIEVKVQLKNLSKAVPSTYIKYTVDGITIDSAKLVFNPILNKNALYTYLFPKKYSTLKPGIHTIKVFVEVREQRGLEEVYADFDKSNDTLSVQIITIDSADIRVQSFLNPAANSTVKTATDVIVRIANIGTATISKYKVVLTRNNVLLKEVSFNGNYNIAPNFFKDVPLDYTILPTENNQYEYCAYTILFEDSDFTNDTTCINISTSVGMNVDLNKTLIVFPNPVKDKLMFNSTEDLNSAIINIYNTLGQKITESNVNYNYVDVSNLVPGMYTFSLEHNNVMYRGKFVK